MTIVRVIHDKENPYVVMNKTGLNDPRLSFKAKGVLAYLLGRPDDWIVYVSHLAKQSTDGKSAVRSALKELIEHGYATFERERDEEGHYAGGNYTVFETPRSSFPNVDNPNEGNRTLLSNDSKLNNDNTIAPPVAAESPLPPPVEEKLEVEEKPEPEKVTAKHPAVKEFRAQAHRYPAKSWYEDVAQTVGKVPADVERWGRVVHAWVGCGWNPTNVRGMIDHFVTNRMPATNGSREFPQDKPEPVPVAVGMGESVFKEGCDL